MNVFSKDGLNMNLLLYLLHVKLIWPMFVRLHVEQFLQESSASYVISFQEIV